jgi:Ion channel.
MKQNFRKTSKFLFRAITQPVLLTLILVGNGFLVICAVFVYFLERDTNPSMANFLNVLWWAVSTITTVGFGDIVPQTIAGRLIGIVLMYTGTVLFITFTSLLATYWISRGVEVELLPIEAEIEKEERETFSIEKTLKSIQRRLDQMETRFSHMERTQRRLGMRQKEVRRSIVFHPYRRR